MLYPKWKKNAVQATLGGLFCPSSVLVRVCYVCLYLIPFLENRKEFARSLEKFIRFCCAYSLNISSGKASLFEAFFWWWFHLFKIAKNCRVARFLSATVGGLPHSAHILGFFTLVRVKEEPSGRENETVFLVTSVTRIGLVKKKCV